MEEWSQPMPYEPATRTRDELVSTNNTLPLCERCGIQMYAGMQHTCARQEEEARNRREQFLGMMV